MNLPQGIPALILLVLVSIVAFLLGIQLSPSRHSHGVYSKESVRWFFKTSPTKFRAFVTGSTAFPFWIWAVYHVISDDIPDVGAMTFLFVMISCALVLFSSSCLCCGVNCSSIILLVSNCLMTLNYGLPVFANLPLSFKIYLASGALYWTFMSYWNWTSVSVSEIESVSQRQEEREEEVAIADKEYGSVV